LWIIGSKSYLLLNSFGGFTELRGRLRPAPEVVKLHAEDVVPLAVK
jgi:hypothetical protein